MSAASTPIPPNRFAAALESLPLSSLHAKAAELRNSITHLQASNQELQPYADAGDKDCADAIVENEEVVRRMEERIALLKREVERRGMRWVEEGGAQEGGMVPLEPGEEDGVEMEGVVRNGDTGAGVERVERDALNERPSTTNAQSAGNARVDGEQYHTARDEGEEDGVYL